MLLRIFFEKGQNGLNLIILYCLKIYKCQEGMKFINTECLKVMKLREERLRFHLTHVL